MTSASVGRTENSLFSNFLKHILKKIWGKNVKLSNKSDRLCMAQLRLNLFPYGISM